MAVNPEKKEMTVKGDKYDPTKDLPTVKVMFGSTFQLHVCVFLQ